ncbi:hypothetical protein [Rhodoferax saidenbachensis]|uniref:Uncharacterized protein n=1 Tax=Rhodoferax saidenbachensis TaxID=1484693 RepID=A0A1P8K817_9BURK|nr:hypothetical protein [Rhodoferax saidenbachensis]APW42126.1 hypothetical protein RS694_05980 [Rhodoferax saidenbachensis]
MYRTKALLAVCLLAAAGMSQGQQGTGIALPNLQPIRDIQISELNQSIQSTNGAIAQLRAVLAAAMNLRVTVPANAPPATATPAGAQKTALEVASRNFGTTLPIATVGELDLAMLQWRKTIDGLSGNVQMMMLRIQSLANKNNDGGTVLITNSEKKIQATRPGDLNGMR